MSLSVALIQMNSGSDMGANITILEALVAEAASKGAQLVATPENTFLMEAPKTARTLYKQEEHPGVQAAASLAKKYKIWLLIGSVAVKTDHAEKTANRALLFGPDGVAAHRYDKIHLFDVDVGDGHSYRESERFLAGERAVLAATPWCGLGMTVCYDLRFPHLYRSLAKAGAQILAVPSAFTAVTGAAHWHVLLRARAIENGCFVIAPAQCGTHPGGRKTYGHSLVVDPWGEIIAERNDDTPGVLMAEIDLEKVAKVRAGLPSLGHDREYELEN
ncbi:MAG: carbon-nitrogen hydrolase family protein [Rickettsiales bacterium]|nr:carbon-nitrogen hydrolase family protein [Rickettsiales bacterium]